MAFAVFVVERYFKSIYVKYLDASEIEGLMQYSRQTAVEEGHGP